MRNLLITTYGKYNHITDWLSGVCNFNTFFLNYDVYPTYKYEGIAKMFELFPQLLDYDYFYMPDEDISISTMDINQIFERMRVHNLDLAQPSVEESAESFLSWKIFKHDYRKAQVIPTDFIECMNPCFSREALLKCLPTFTKSKSGYGLDLVWPKLIGNTGTNIAILNCIVVKHTRPVGKGDLYRKLAYQGINPDNEMNSLIKEYDIKFDTKAHN